MMAVAMIVTKNLNQNYIKRECEQILKKGEQKLDDAEILVLIAHQNNSAKAIEGVCVE